MVHPKVLIVMGSKSDLKIMEETAEILKDFDVPHRLRVASAHRTPLKTATLAREAVSQGVKVIIAGAGYAAHLAGALAAHTTLPVIGVPLEGSALSGVDALLSTAQMPAGVPVATVTIGKAGAKNAAILAVQILALSDEKLAKKLESFKKELAAKVEADDNKIAITNRSQKQHEA